MAKDNGGANTETRGGGGKLTTRDGGTKGGGGKLSIKESKKD
jgi:hypothetical protein